MGQLTHDHNWSQTPLGSPDTWPQSLAHTVSLVLHAALPTLLFWGPGSLTTFYNDAFLNSTLGKGKGHALGRPAPELWAEAWPQVQPLLEGVLETGVPVYRDDLLLEQQGGQGLVCQFSCSAVLNEDGVVSGLLVTCKDTTAQVRALEQTRESEAKYRYLFEQMDQGFCIAEVIYNKEGKAVDYRFCEVNPVFESHTGLKNARGRTAKELLPGLEDHWIQIYGKVASTGESVRFMEGSEVMSRWFEVYAFRLGGAESRKIAILFTDISQRHKAEKQLEENKDLLQSVFEASPNSLTIFEPVYNSRGAVEDYRFLIVNNFTVQTTGRADLVGRLYGETFPHVRTNGILDQFHQVAQTGRSADFETWYEGEGLKHWFRMIVTRVGSLITVTSEDITLRKITSEAIRKSEERFQNLVRDATAAIIVLTGPEMRVEIANRAYGKLIQRSASQLIGKPLFDVIPEIRDFYLPLLEKVRLTGEPIYLYDSPYSVTTNGQFIEGFLHIVIQPYRDTAGNMLGIMAILQDVTEQVRVQKELEEKEQHLELLSNTVPAMIFYLDCGQRYRSYNETFMQWFGVNEKEAIGKTVKEFIGDAAYSKAAPYLDIAYNGQQVRYEMEAPDKIGTGRWLQIVYTPHINEEGRVVGVIVLATDITQSKQAEILLRESRQQLLSSFNDMPVGLALISGNDLVFDVVNPFYGRLAGRAPGELVGKPLMEAIPELKGQGFDVKLRSVMATGKPFNENGVPVDIFDNGREVTIYINHTYQPQRDSRGEITGVLIVVIDVTEQILARQKIEDEVTARTRELAEANETLYTLNKELKRSNYHLEEFAHAASHDLKEPIRKIHYFTARLKEQLNEQLTEEQGFTFSRISNATERMGMLINDLLLYSHVSQRPHEKEMVDLNEKIRRVQEDLELDILQKGATIRAARLPQVRGYSRQIQQLFQNLISNALKYSKEDQPPKIEINSSRVEREGREHLQIGITDNGIGFEQEYHEKIFQMFTRLHGKNEYGGTGVGLSIVKKIVENHEGHIRVESQKGVGTTFYIYLPLQ